MSRRFRVGAIAAAATLFVTMFGAGMSGARAEIQAPMPAAEPAPPKESAALPRFVAEPVVQPLPAATASSPAATLEHLVETMTDGDLSDDMRCLAGAVYFEARGEPIEGQLAVAEVVINRSQSNLYPSDYCSVVTQPAQFSFVRRGVIPQPDTASRAWRRAKAIARIAHQELWKTEAGDALFFHANYVNPGWARRKVQLARIDTHIFYR